MLFRSIARTSLYDLSFGVVYINTIWFIGMTVMFVLEELMEPWETRRKKNEKIKLDLLSFRYRTPFSARPIPTYGRRTPVLLD